MNYHPAFQTPPAYEYCQEVPRPALPPHTGDAIQSYDDTKGAVVIMISQQIARPMLPEEQLARYRNVQNDCPDAKVKKDIAIL